MSPSTSKHTPEDWRRDERRKTTMRIFVVFGGPTLIAACIMAMTYLVFLRDWPLWLLPIGVFTIIGCIWGCNVDDYRVDEFVLKLVSGALTAVCLIAMIVYGLSKESGAHDIARPRVLACGLDTERDDDGNIHWILRTPEGSYNVEAGTYYILEKGKLQKRFAATAEQAAKLFEVESAYKLSVDPFEGESYDGIISATEQPNNLGQCSD